jgi:FMN phosphatase YigB (HAD superfamily)
MTLNHTPKVVLFDLGKVLVHFDWSIAARNIAPHCRYQAGALLDKMMKSPLLPRYELGQLSSAQFFEEVRNGIGYRGAYAEFAAAFGGIFSEISAMTTLQARVRAAGFPTYVFSNTNDLAIATIRHAFPFFLNFDGYFLSYELGIMKPAPGIYEAAERQTGCQGAEILYLDDSAENTAAGAARGWRTLVHTAPEQTIPQVEQLLQLPSAPAHGRPAGRVDSV